MTILTYTEELLEILQGLSYGNFSVETTQLKIDTLNAGKTGSKITFEESELEEIEEEDEESSQEYEEESSSYEE